MTDPDHVHTWLPVINGHNEIVKLFCQCGAEQQYA